MKKINVSKKDYTIIVNLNSDYFINRFNINKATKYTLVELIRLDKTLLLSTNEKKHINKKIDDNLLFDESLKKNQITNIEKINEKEFITSYVLTQNYPLNITVKLDYEKSLQSWEKRQYNFFIVLTIILTISILISLILFYLYTKKREREIFLQKKQIQNQEKFKLLFQNSNFLAAVLNKNGKIDEINDITLKFLGKDKSEIINKNFWELNCWDNTNKIKDMILNYKKQVTSEINATNKSNKIKTLEFTLTSIKFDDEDILITIGVDITQRKEREKELKQAYTVFNNTRDGIIITDESTQILDVNKAFENITGYEKKDILLKNKSVKVKYTS